jgi:CubicO group peptidase (beta-lactamase class C family)
MRMRTLPLGLALALAIFASTSVAQTTRRQSESSASDFADRARLSKLISALPAIDSLMSAFALRAKVPGIAYGIIVDGKVIHIGVSGVRNATTNAPIDTNTVFRIASMTKSFTALSILQLRDAGKLSLDDPAERYLPELKQLHYPTTDSPKITIRHLLSHSAGFPEDNPWGDQQLAATDAEMSAMIRRGIPFSTSPGTN